MRLPSQLELGRAKARQHLAFLDGVADPDRFLDDQPVDLAGDCAHLRSLDRAGKPHLPAHAVFTGFGVADMRHALGVGLGRQADRGGQKSKEADRAQGRRNRGEKLHPYLSEKTLRKLSLS